MLKKHKQQVILLIIAFMFLMGVGVYVGVKIGQQQPSTGQEKADQIADEDEGQVYTDPNAVSIDQEYIDSLNERSGILDEHSRAYAQTIKYHLFTDVWSNAGSIEQELPIWNDPSNKQSFRVQVWLLEDLPDGQNEQMTAAFIKTGSIAPGQMIMKVNLGKSLATGTYPAVFIYTPIGSAGTDYSTFEARATIHVQ